MEVRTRKRNRLTEYDYAAPNAYFITVCTQNRRNFFWDTVGATIGRPEEIPYTIYGKIVKQHIGEIPRHYPAVSVDKYVIMPNHIHLLLQINTDEDGRAMPAPTISTLINQLKGAVTKKAGFPVWQKGFYDHVIRGEQDYREIWEYIAGNPFRWQEDKLYTE